jgi:formamidopyrimidine-DNA glycosylase
MPELPEVETTCRGLRPLVADRLISAVRIRAPRLRWPVPRQLGHVLPGSRVCGVDRRAKYLLIVTEVGTLILHLGMSGSLRVVPVDNLPGPHDHFEIAFTDGKCLRLRDPRRFGCVLWTTEEPARHRLLSALGPEPLSDALSGEYLYARSRGRATHIKSFIMNAGIVAGIGNIYANESLFAAGIHPQRRAGRISLQRYAHLADGIKNTLRRAIRAGGTTLRDFSREDGNPGYFQHKLRVYGRDGVPCPRCRAPIRRRVVAQRSTYFCARCQR